MISPPKKIYIINIMFMTPKIVPAIIPSMAYTFPVNFLFFLILIKEIIPKIIPNKGKIIINKTIHSYHNATEKRTKGNKESTKLHTANLLVAIAFNENLNISKSPCVYLGLKAEVCSGLLDTQSAHALKCVVFSSTLV